MTDNPENNGQDAPEPTDHTSTPTSTPTPESSYAAGLSEEDTASLVKDMGEMLKMIQSLKASYIADMMPMRLIVDTHTKALKVIRDILKQHDENFGHVKAAGEQTGLAGLDIVARLERLETAFANLDKRVSDLEELAANAPSSEYVETNITRLHERMDRARYNHDSDIRRVESDLETRIGRVENDLRSHTNSNHSSGRGW